MRTITLPAHTVGLLLLLAPPLLALAASVPCGAQEEEAARVAATLGQGDVSSHEILTIGPYAFTPRHNSPAPAFLGCAFQSDGHCRNIESGSDPLLYAPLELPAGALIEALVCYVKDTSPSLDVDAWLGFRAYPTGNSVVASVETAGTPGATILTDNDVGHTVHYMDEPRAYHVGLTLRDDSDLGFWGCEVYWRRQVSPPPATATFDDVPTDHLFFQQIEALAASGITSGCGDDDFCPADPLTRGQMAAFLAKALGLHWSEISQ